MVTGDPVDLNLTMSSSSHKILALLTKNSAQPCQTGSNGEILWIRVCPTDDDDDDDDDDVNLRCRLCLSKPYQPLNTPAPSHL